MNTRGQTGTSLNNAVTAKYKTTEFIISKNKIHGHLIRARISVYPFVLIKQVKSKQTVFLTQVLVNWKLNTNWSLWGGGWGGTVSFWIHATNITFGVGGIAGYR